MSDPAPPRRDDKFASLQASRHSAVQSRQQQTPPKRDKFASMAASQESPTSQPSGNTPPPILPSTAVLAPASSKCDKFASMAARQQLASDSASVPVAPPPATVAPKRDKFASMAQSTAKKPKRDKFASLAQHSNPPDTRINEPKRRNEERMQALKKRIQQRQTVLKDLEKAEGHTWNLIQLSSKTAKHLTKLVVEEDSAALSDICSKYRGNLQQIHSLLSPHAKFVKSYQNFDRSHQEASEATNMYAARVETRLAQERRKVLQELLRVEERETPNEDMTAKKRKRNE